MANTKKNTKKKSTKKTNNSSSNTKKTTNTKKVPNSSVKKTNNSAKEEKEKVIEDEVKVKKVDKKANKVEIKKNNNFIDGKRGSGFWSNEEAVKMLKIFIVVAVVFAAVFLLTAYIRGDFKKKEDPVVPATIQDVKILSSRIYDKKDDDYYVFIYDFESDDATLFGDMMSNFTSLGSEVMYSVDLSNKLNQDIVAKDEKSKVDGNKLSDLKVKDPVIIHLKKNKYVESFEGKEKIKKFFSDKIKENNEKNEESEDVEE